METTRQQKIAKQIQKDVAEIFQKEGEGIVRGSLVTVTAVRVSPDFGYAKIYVSVFPFGRSAALMQELDRNNKFIRHALGQRIRNQVKNVPEIQFFLDDSLSISTISSRRSKTTNPSGLTPCCRSSSPAATSSRPNPDRSSI